MNTDSLPMCCNQSESVCAAECNLSAVHVFAAADSTQLVDKLAVFWLYLEIKAGMLSVYAILQLNHHLAATTSLFVEAFINICFKSMWF